MLWNAVFTRCLPSVAAVASRLAPAGRYSTESLGDSGVLIEGLFTEQHLELKRSLNKVAGILLLLSCDFYEKLIFIPINFLYMSLVAFIYERLEGYE